MSHNYSIDFSVWAPETGRAITTDLVLDIKKQLEDINELDCPFQKTLKLKDFSVALDTLIGK